MIRRKAQTARDEAEEKRNGQSRDTNHENSWLPTSSDAKTHITSHRKVYHPNEFATGCSAAAQEGSEKTQQS